MSTQHHTTPSTAGTGDQKWKHTEKSAASTIAEIDLGTADSVIRKKIETINSNCIRALSTAADSLGRIRNVKTLLRAGTDLDDFHQSIRIFAQEAKAMSKTIEGKILQASGSSLAWKLMDAVRDYAKVEKEATKDWLDNYAEHRPGPKIALKEVEQSGLDWDSVNNLRITLRGPNRMPLRHCRSVMLLIRLSD
jgi:hypothetical protein